MKPVYLVASGDLREAANQLCWPTQSAMEDRLTQALEAKGRDLKRGHPFSEKRKHGFIASQREGMNVFGKIDRQAPLIVAESVWQFSHHVLPGLIRHQGPILTLANWSGQWPGLVGVLNLNGSLTKAKVAYSTLWSEDFSDAFFSEGMDTWLKSGSLVHPSDHVLPFEEAAVTETAKAIGEQLANEIRESMAILGVFDEGCMGMHNAILPDELLFPLGVFKERLSQSALYAAMQNVTETEALNVMHWLVKRGFTFEFGVDEATELTRRQVLEQCRMYIAACRIGDAYGCDAIGIQYQQGLNELCAASDLVEGLLNNSDRPPVYRKNGSEIKPGQPFTHFNEVDEAAGLDGIMIQRVHDALNQAPENTLHDLRWGDWDKSETTSNFVWTLQISGAAPAAHHKGGYAGSTGHRQVPMYFPAGGSTLSGVAKSGEIIWSRIYVEEGRLKMDIGRGQAIDLPPEETERRRQATTPQWPIMHAVFYGISRDQMMGRHKANHIQVAYANDGTAADLCCYTRAAMANAFGIDVFFCGTRENQASF